MDSYNEFMIWLPGFQSAEYFYSMFPHARAFPESRNPYLSSSPESALFAEGAGYFFRSLNDMNDIENGGGFDAN